MDTLVFQELLFFNVDNNEISTKSCSSLPPFKHKILKMQNMY